MLAVHVPTAQTVTITAVSAQAFTGLDANVRYMLVATIACWVAQGATLQTAAIGGASASCLIPANTPIYFWGDDGAVLSVIGTAGTLTCTAVAE